MPGRHRRARPRNARRGGSQVDSANHRRGRRRQDHDRLVARRGGRGADRGGARARRGRYHAQARNRPLQWQIFGDPARASSRRSALPRRDAGAGREPAGPRRRFAPCPAIRSTCWRSVLQLAASTRSACCSRRFRGGSACRSSSPSICRSRSCSVFARQLGAVAQREAMVAEDGMQLIPDRILLAPGDAHLTLDPGPTGAVVRLNHGRSTSGCMPSVDPDVRVSRRDLRHPCARRGVDRHGPRRSGRSGSVGRLWRFDSGSRRSELCCVGNARAVLEAGLAAAALPPDKIARRIASRTEEPRTCK